MTEIKTEAGSVEAIENIAAGLWRLLDNIDTADDAARNDDAAFRDYARAQQQLRFALMSGEEWDRIMSRRSRGSER